MHLIFGAPGRYIQGPGVISQIGACIARMGERLAGIDALAATGADHDVRFSRTEGRLELLDAFCRYLAVEFQKCNIHLRL